MNYFDDIQQATRGVQSYLMAHGAELPQFTRDKILDALAQPSPVDNLMRSLDALYAARTSLGTDGKNLVASLANFVTPMGWHGIQEDNRGPRIQFAMQRDLRHKPPTGREWPAADTDPAPNSDYIEPEPDADPSSAVPPPAPATTAAGA